jgi:hypothetical protein
MMKRLFISVLVLATILSPLQGGSNITQRAVYLSERVVLVRFFNMGVDAYWGDHILENAAAALPILENLIGVSLPEEVETVEIYGKKTLGVAEWVVGYNDGHLVALKTDHPDPTIVFHELVHFWTTYYHIPWPLAEGYCNMYADLCATHLGLYEVTYADIDWEQEYQDLQNHKGRTALNNLNYMSGDTAGEQRDYFYLASTVMMYNFYETVGEENLKAINRVVAESSLDGTRGGIGIVQYLGIASEVTGVNYAKLFMPVVFLEWEQEHVDAFEEAVGRYSAVAELTGAPASAEQKLALTSLVSGKFAEFHTMEQTIITDFYAKQVVEQEELPEQEIIYPEKKTGLLYNKLFIAGIIMLVVVVVLLIFILSKIAKEEEVFGWEEQPIEEGPALWSPPEQGFAEETEELPELPDLEEMTK